MAEHHCRHCNQPIRTTTDPNMPWVHTETHNSYCDVTTPASAVGASWANPYGLRTEAEPAEHCTGETDG